MIYINKFLDYLEYELQHSKNTISSYKNDLDKFSAYLDELGKDELLINSNDILLFLETIDDYKENTKAHYITVLNAYFKFLYVKKYLDKDLSLEIEYPKKQTKLVEFLTKDEVYALADASSNVKERLIVLLMFKTGIRVSEATAIRLNDINQIDLNIKIHGKGNKERVVLFDSEVSELLKIYLNTYKISDYLLINDKNKPADRFYIYNLLKKLAVKAGIKKNIYPHILRHSFASYMLENGVDLRLLQVMLGHEDITTTTIYTHITTKNLQKWYNKYHPLGKGE